MASFFREKGLEKGDCVALMMETKIEYPFFWLGLSRIGATTALINFNLRQDPLIHSIKIVNSKAIIVSSDLKDAIAQIRDHPDIKGLPIYQYNSKKEEVVELLPSATDLRAKLETVTLKTDFSDATFHVKDKLLYIYTSGTTGLPKAAVITHVRFMTLVTSMCYTMRLNKNDRTYVALPLYHALGGMIGVGNMMLHSVPIALRTKFSASNFWGDCARYDCTVAIYIGEICRFLLATPEKPSEKQHRVRIIIGNGLKPGLWKQFVERFNIPQVGEFYGSTEGNCGLGYFFSNYIHDDGECLN